MEKFKVHLMFFFQTSSKFHLTSISKSVILYIFTDNNNGEKRRQEMEATKLTKLTFIGYDEKQFFVKENAISQNEIVEETPGSIVLIEPSYSNVNWEANGFVYTVKVIEFDELTIEIQK